jgi:hypothetical protein
LEKIVQPVIDEMAQWFDGTETNPAKFSQFVQRYVHFVTGKESCRVIVLRHIKPRSPFKFLVHILLSMGRFATGTILVFEFLVTISLQCFYANFTLLAELDLFKHGNLRIAFRNSGLLVEPSDAAFPTLAGKQEELHRQAIALYSRWFHEHHFARPVTQTPSMEIAIEARDLLVKFFTENRVVMADYPLMLWKHLRADFVAKQKQAIDAQQAQLVRALTTGTPGIQDSTDENDRKQLIFSKLLTGEDQKWEPEFTPIANQDPASIREQTATLNGLVDAVKAVVDKSAIFVPSQMIIGPPGAGKTHLLKMGCLYARSRGLNVVLTSLTGEIFKWWGFCFQNRWSLTPTCLLLR